MLRFSGGMAIGYSSSLITAWSPPALFPPVTLPVARESINGKRLGATSAKLERIGLRSANSGRSDLCSIAATGQARRPP